MPEGRVLQVWRWPVKSMGGERVRSTHVDARGVGGDRSWDDPRLRTALAEDLGRPVRLRRDIAGIRDLERSLLITVEATRAALAGELGTELDLRRFRPNLHLELGTSAWAEHAWEGATVRFAGGAVLRLLHPCVRCAIPTRDPDTQQKWPGLLRHLDARHETLFGINARVLQAGRIAADEAVQIDIVTTAPPPRGR